MNQAWVKFAGWFQCRLATDPDPSDEPRGVSGYMQAVVGEPDLDRVIRLQPNGATPRSHCPPIGVAVVAVYGDGRHEPTKHPLVGASVDLLDEPKFEGRNHILANDGVEAVVPCNLNIVGDSFSLSRKFSDSMKFPPESAQDYQDFAQLQASGVNISPGAIGEATGIFDLGAVWVARTAALKADLAASTSDMEKAALATRIAGMSNPGNARFFTARMLYQAALAGTVSVNDPNNLLPGAPLTQRAWPLEFWFGAWDADAMCGYMVGYLGVPSQANPDLMTGIAAMMIDPKQERR